MFRYYWISTMKVYGLTNRKIYKHLGGGLYCGKKNNFPKTTENGKKSIKVWTLYVSSISVPNEPLISWTFLGPFCHHFWMGAKQQTHPKVVKKCSTDQRFIRKITNTHKIHTLIYQSLLKMGKKPLPAAGAWQLLCMWESNINKENIRIQL